MTGGLVVKDYGLCLGAWLNMTVQLSRTDGGQIDPARSYTISGVMYVPAGTLNATVTKLDNTKFKITFDLDGERGTENLVASSGTHSVVVNITEDDPIYGKRLKGSDIFSVTITPSSFSVAKPITALPEDAIRGYQDLSSGIPSMGRYIPILVSPARLDEYLIISFNLGRPNRTATVSSFAVKRTAPLVGPYQIDSKVLITGKTGSDGRISLAVKGKDLIGNASSGLVIIAGYLSGASQDTYLAAQAFAVPVSDHICKVDGYQLSWEYPPFYEGTTDVIIEDLDGGSIGVAYATSPGDLFVISPLGNVWQYAFDPANPQSHYRAARIQNSDTLSASISSYIVIGMLYSGENFYGIAYGSRGFIMSASAGPCIVNKDGKINIKISSLTSNYDADLDSGCSIKVRLAAKNVPGVENWSEEVEVPELGQITKTIVFKANRTGTYYVVIEATSSGLQCNQTVSVRVIKPEEAKKGTIFGIPGFEVPLLLCGLLMALIRRRR